jgi:hypothetical protein
MEKIIFVMSLLGSLASFTARAASLEFEVDSSDNTASVRLSSDFDVETRIIYPVHAPLPAPPARRRVVRVWRNVDDWGTMREVRNDWDDTLREIPVPAPEYRWVRSEPLPPRPIYKCRTGDMRPCNHHPRARSTEYYYRQQRLPSKRWEQLGQVDVSLPYREF